MNTKIKTNFFIFKNDDSIQFWSQIKENSKILRLRWKHGSLIAINLINCVSHHLYEIITLFYIGFALKKH